MADSRISDLLDGSPFVPGDLLVIARSGANYKIDAVELVDDGWIPATSETWTYASGSGGGTATFTVTGDLTAKYSPGTRIKLTQTTVKYFVVASSSHAGGTTTVTITAGSDYTLANAAISSNYYSYAENPQGYPTWFAYAPNGQGFSSKTSDLGYFMVNGRMCKCIVDISGTSNATTLTYTAPITAAAANRITGYGYARVTNSGTVAAGPGRLIVTASSTTITATRDLTGTAWTNSGTKGIGQATLDYEI